jgi:regulator of extracellular matrix RemA (YlzA/DUF370 family)
LCTQARVYDGAIATGGEMALKTAENGDEHGEHAWFAQWVRRSLRRAGSRANQTSLAHRWGIPEQTMRHYMAGHAAPDATRLRRMLSRCEAADRDDLLDALSGCKTTVTRTTDLRRVTITAVALLTAALRDVEWTGGAGVAQSRLIESAAECQGMLGAAVRTAVLTG